MSDYKEADQNFINIPITTMSSLAAPEETYESGDYEDQEEDQESSKNANKLFFG